MESCVSSGNSGIRYYVPSHTKLNYLNITVYYQPTTCGGSFNLCYLWCRWASPPFQPPPPARPDSISEWQIPFQTDNPQAFTKDASYTLPCAPSQTSLVLLITPVPAASIMDKNLKTVVHLWLFKHVQNKDLHEMHSTCGTRCIVHVACTSPHPILGDEGGTCNRLLKYRTAVGCNGQIIDNYWSCMTVPRNFVHDCRSQHICRPLKYLEDYIEEQFV